MSKKDTEGKPKKGLNAFMFFCNEKRSEVKNEFPDLKVGEIGKKLGEMWRNLSDDKKEPYKQKALKDKERYKNEVTKLGGVKKSRAQPSDSDKSE